MRLKGVVLAMVLALPASALAARRVALMPLGNVSGKAAARTDAQRELSLQLTRAGFEVISGDPVERLLASARIRYVESLSPAMADRILTELGAEAIVFATVLSYREEPPAAGMSIRVIVAGGRTMVTATYDLTEADTVKVLGLGRVHSASELLRRVAGRLVASLPASGATADAQRAPRRLHTSSVRTYRSPALNGGPKLVCVLPLQNQTGDRKSGRLFIDVLTARLRNGKIRVVEPAEFRSAMVAEEIYSVDGIDSERLRALGKRLGTNLFVRGTIYSFTERGPSGSPEVELYLSMVDAERGRIVWTSHRHAVGNEYITLLQRNAVSGAVALVDQVLAEMVEAMLRA